MTDDEPDIITRFCDFIDKTESRYKSDPVMDKYTKNVLMPREMVVELANELKAPSLWRGDEVKLSAS